LRYQSQDRAKKKREAFRQRFAERNGHSHG
jgi:hypothetical protein